MKSEAAAAAEAGGEGRLLKSGTAAARTRAKNADRRRNTQGRSRLHKNSKTGGDGKRGVRRSADTINNIISLPAAEGGKEEFSRCKVQNMLPRPVTLALHAALLSLQALFTVATARRLVLFTSWEQQQQQDEGDAWDLLTNLLLCLCFCLHHSATRPSLVLSLRPGMNPDWVKTYYKLAYAAGTNATLTVLTECWRPYRPALFWSLDLSEPQWSYAPSLLWLLHLYCWTVVAASFVVMDLPDLMGVRPVYHRVFLQEEFDCEEEEDGPHRRNDLSYEEERPPPVPNFAKVEVDSRKDYDSPQKLSPEHAGFRRRFRHGSFAALSVVLTCRTQMGADRAALAAAWMAYMWHRFRPNRRDLVYQRDMWQSKKRQLDRL